MTIKICFQTDFDNCTDDFLLTFTSIKLKERIRLRAIADLLGSDAISIGFCHVFDALQHPGIKIIEKILHNFIL